MQARYVALSQELISHRRELDALQQENASFKAQKQVEALTVLLNEKGKKALADLQRLLSEADEQQAKLIKEVQ